MAPAFGDVIVGEWFDFIDDSSPYRTTWFGRCRKTSSRTYVEEDGTKHTVGSVNARVFHVGKEA